MCVRAKVGKMKIIKHVTHSRLYCCGSNWLPVFSSSSSLTWSSILFPFTVLSFLSSFFLPSTITLSVSSSSSDLLLIPPSPFPRSPPPPLCVSWNITLCSLAPLPPELSSLPFHLHLFLVPLWLCSWKPKSRPVRRHVALLPQICEISSLHSCFCSDRTPHPTEM